MAEGCKDFKGKRKCNNEFLYQDDTKIAKLQKMIDQVQGNCFWLYVFGD